MSKYVLQATGDLVERELWRWEVQYNDGSVLKQFDDSSALFHQFAEIEQDRLEVFRMVHDMHPPFILLFPQGAKLVHKYINSILNAGTQQEYRMRLYAFGYIRNGESHFLAITPEHVAIITDNLNDIQVTS